MLHLHVTVSYPVGTWRRIDNVLGTESIHVHEEDVSHFLAFKNVCNGNVSSNGFNNSMLKVPSRDRVTNFQRSYNSILL